MRNFPAGHLWLLIVTTACSSSLFRLGESATDTGDGGTPVREVVAPCNTEWNGVQQRAVDRNSYYAYPRPIYDYPKSHTELKECVTDQRHQPLCSCSTPKKTNIYDTPRPWNGSHSLPENEDNRTQVGGNFPASHTSPSPRRTSTLPSVKSSSSDFEWLKSGTQHGGHFSPQDRISSSALRGVVEPQCHGTQPGKRMPATSTETEKASTEENATSAVWNSLGSRKEDEKKHWKSMPTLTFAYDSASQPSKKSDVSTLSYELVDALLNEVPQKKAPHVDRRTEPHRFSLRLPVFNQKSKRKPSPMPRTLLRNSSKKSTSESSGQNKTLEGSTITDTVAPKHIVQEQRELPPPPAEVYQKHTVREQRELPTPPAQVYQKDTVREQRELPTPPAQVYQKDTVRKQRELPTPPAQVYQTDTVREQRELPTPPAQVYQKDTVREQRELPTPPAQVYQTGTVREQRELPAPPAQVYQTDTVREQRELPLPPAEFSYRLSMLQLSEEQEVITPRSTDALASRDQLIRQRLSPHVLNAVLKTEQRILKALQDGALMEFLSSRTGAEQFAFFAHVAARFAEGLKLTPAERLFVMWGHECPKLTHDCSHALLLEMVYLFEFIAGVRPLEVPPAVKVLLSSATKGDRPSVMVANSSTPPPGSSKSRGKLSAEPFTLFFHRISSDNVRKELVDDLMGSWSQFASEIKNLVYHKNIKKSMDYASYRTRFIVYAYTGAAMKFNEETNFFPQRVFDPVEDALNKCFTDTDLARRMADPEVRSTFVGEIRVKYL